MEEDRISQLPDPILHHILCLLPQKNAVRTCILSKSWRHLGSTRPKIEFHESYFAGKKQQFLPVLENTLQRYDDQKLPIQEFILGVSVSDSESSKTILLLNKWIPIVLLNMGVKTFKLRANLFSPPSAVFEAESLQELYLEGCTLNQISNSFGNVQVLNRLLRTLSLRKLLIEEETFEKIMSSCPLIQHLVLSSCHGLKAIKVNNARNLKHLDCFISSEIDCFITIKNVSIEIDDAPSLETIRICSCNNGYHLHSSFFFPRLKSLYLWNVHLPTESLNNLSPNNCPCLEELQLHYCYGFTEFELSNCSIKRLIINVSDLPIEAANIDVANILYFELVCSYLPSISFTTTSREWESGIKVCRRSDSKEDVLSTWSLKLHEILKALSQSQISLDISYLPNLTNQDTYDGGSCEPVVVEHLCLRKYYSSSEVPTLLNCVFRICRPRYIGLSLYNNSQKIHENQLAESIWKTLETTQCEFWQLDLEESSIQVLEENANEWHPGQVCAFSNNQSIRFWLKWRDLS